MENKTVLFVEDDPIYAGFALSSIAKAGLPFAIQHVRSTDEALIYLRGEPPYSNRAMYPMPAVVLLDIMLTGQLGFPVLSWLRDHGHLDHEKTRVVMLTASDRAPDVQQALKLGALSYLVKSPFPENLIKLLGKFSIR